MPEFLSRWLKGLSDEKAKKLWEYFDSTPHLPGELINGLLDSHPSLCPQREEDKKL